ncbi:MAG: GxxExxY protein [Alphaproteobacteria bacterium HGW-Alphaproteobacteria-7]|jgi:iron complex transport system substrate-binding protein|nr:MAG: GxxExxY protein [Alphaproteobacteria bacterium HGW-Alphaproteobacteria-7]
MKEPHAELDTLARTIVDTAFRLHRDLGPGLLESAYEALLAARLERDGLVVGRQVPVDACFDGIVLPAAYKIDLLIKRSIVIEIKSVERASPVHAKQALTYLKLGGFPLGFVINFGTPLFKDGIKRLINNTAPLATWRLGANPKD